MKKYFFIALIIFINVMLFAYLSEQIRQEATKEESAKCQQQILELKRFGEVITK